MEHPDYVNPKLSEQEQHILDVMKKTVDRFPSGFQSELFKWVGRGLEFSVDPENEKIFIYRKSFDRMSESVRADIERGMRESTGVEIIDKIPSQSEALKEKIQDFFMTLLPF